MGQRGQVPLSQCWDMVPVPSVPPWEVSFMKSIGVITNVHKDPDAKYAKLVEESVIKFGGTFVGLVKDNGDADPCVPKNEFDVLAAKSDVGDGTFLKAARSICHKGKPLLGINLGRLGFLAEVDIGGIEDAVRRVVSGEYAIEERMLLDVSVLRGQDIVASDLALNDAVVSRGAFPRILHIRTYVDDMFADSFPGDGVIVSSATGSTAYSLSAGGPVVEPGVDLMIVTPICPHILRSRSIIVKGDREVKVEVGDDYYHDAILTVDGQSVYDLKGGDEILVRKAKETVKLVQMNTSNFFDILRTKIYDRAEKLKNRQ